MSDELTALHAQLASKTLKYSEEKRIRKQIELLEKQAKKKVQPPPTLF